MQAIGRWLIVFGALLLSLGVILQFGWKIPIIGRLPGDFRYEGEHFSVYFPFATCVLLSLLFTLFFNLARRM